MDTSRAKMKTRVRVVPIRKMRIMNSNDKKIDSGYQRFFLSFFIYLFIHLYIYLDIDLFICCSHLSQFQPVKALRFFDFFRLNIYLSTFEVLNLIPPAFVQVIQESIDLGVASTKTNAM